jgi:hypothetical protein
VRNGGVGRTRGDTLGSGGRRVASWDTFTEPGERLPHPLLFVKLKLKVCGLNGLRARPQRLEGKQENSPTLSAQTAERMGHPKSSGGAATRPPHPPSFILGFRATRPEILNSLRLSRNLGLRCYCRKMDQNTNRKQITIKTAQIFRRNTSLLSG